MEGWRDGVVEWWSGGVVEGSRDGAMEGWRGGERVRESEAALAATRME